MFNIAYVSVGVTRPTTTNSGVEVPYTTLPLIRSPDDARSYVAALNLRFKEQFEEKMGELSDKAFEPDSQLDSGTYRYLSDALMDAYNVSPNTPGLPASVLGSAVMRTYSEQINQASAIWAGRASATGGPGYNGFDVLSQVGLNFHTSRQNNVGVSSADFKTIIHGILNGQGFEELSQRPGSEHLLSMVPKDALTQQNFESIRPVFVEHVGDVIDDMVIEETSRLTNPDRMSDLGAETIYHDNQVVNGNIAGAVFADILSGRPVREVSDNYNISDMSEYIRMNQRLCEIGNSTITPDTLYAASRRL